MPESLSARFNGNAQEVVEYAKVWGKFKAMEKYGVKDYLAFNKFLEAKTGNENYGLCPILGGQQCHSWAEDLLDAFDNKIRKMESENHALKMELKKAKIDLEYYKTQGALKIETKVHRLLQKCQE